MHLQCEWRGKTSKTIVIHSALQGREIEKSLWKHLQRIVSNTSFFGTNSIANRERHKRRIELERHKKHINGSGNDLPNLSRELGAILLIIRHSTPRTYAEKFQFATGLFPQTRHCSESGCLHENTIYF